MPHQLSPDIVAFLNLETTKSFLLSAQQFVDIIETEDIPIDTFLNRIHTALISLYASGMQLTEIELKYSTAYESEGLFENKNQQIVSNLGDDAFYFETFDPTYEKKESPSQGWLVDDFADIYQDIKIELMKLNVGTDEATEDAFWELKFSFKRHWGNHCINALRYLHYYWYKDKS